MNFSSSYCERTDLAGNKKTPASIHRGGGTNSGSRLRGDKHEVTLLSHQKTGFAETNKKVLDCGWLAVVVAAVCGCGWWLCLWLLAVGCCCWLLAAGCGGGCSCRLLATTAGCGCGSHREKTYLARNKKTPATIYRGVDPIVDPDTEKTKTKSKLTHQKFIPA